MLKKLFAASCLIFLALCGFSSSLTAQNPQDWTEPIEPFKIADNLYYVGSKGLASYLIVTPKGNILINSSLVQSPPLIKAAIEKLGFKYADTKILLISHAHWDHNAGSAAVLKETGAKYMVMSEDVPEVLDGGKSNWQYGSDLSTHYPAAKVDRVLRDLDKVELGGAVLTAHLTPGHTKGCTTWTLKVKDKGNVLDAVIVGSPNVNPGYKLVNNKDYPGIASDYEKTFKVLKSLHCDLFLGAHGAYYDMDSKIPKIGKGKGNPFIDPAGYKDYVEDREKAFRKELERQKAGGK